MKRIIVTYLFLCCAFVLSAQLTYGTTGLLHAPSAEMQKDKTIMLGANFMNK
ncbi:YjbH domain-containing protein, partial [Bacteroides cellulosilyticus]